MHAMTNIALRAAREAMEKIIVGSDRPDRLKIINEHPRQFTTSMDQESDATLAYELHKILPDSCIHSRVSGTSGDTGSATHWHINPLFGSLNYYKGLPSYGLSLACVVDNQLTHAVALLPQTGEEFVASRGQGAQRNGKRLRVGSRTTLMAALCGLNYDEGQRDIFNAVQQELQNQGAELRIYGHPAIDMLLIATDGLQAGWCPATSDPALMATRLILQEAGGLVAAADGSPDLSTAKELFFANPLLLRQLVKMRKGIRQ